MRITRAGCAGGTCQQPSPRPACPSSSPAARLGSGTTPGEAQAMANTPDDPNAPKPHDKGKVPPKKTEPDDEDALFEEAPAAGDVENSGISVHEWAALIEEESATDSASGVKVDSPSDT